MEQTTLPLEVREISLDSISADKQVRKHFDQEKLAELAESIKDVGVVQPIVVVPRTVAGGQAVDFKIVSGERRHRAAVLADRQSIPAVIRTDLKTDDIAVIQLVENVQREDLTLPEKAEGCAALVKQLGLEQAATRLGKSKSWVSMRAGVQEMSASIRKAIEKGQLRDVQLAHDLSKLEELDEKRFTDCIQDLLKPKSYSAPVTRERVEDEIRWAKAEAKRKKEAAAQRAKTLAENKKNGVKAQPDPHAARRKQLEVLRPQIEEFKKVATEQMQIAAGLAPDPERDAQIRRPYLSEYDDVPKTVLGVKYYVSLSGNTDEMEAMIKLFDPEGVSTITLECRRLELTIAEWRKVEKVLGRSMDFWYQLEKSGKAICHDIGLDPKNPTQPVSQGKQEKVAGSASASAADSVASFLKACTQKKKGSEVKASDFRAAYEAHCQRHNLEPLSANDNKYRAAILAGGIEKKRAKDGYRYQGVQLLVEAE
jgi:ParB/RepB/Spo0J family partition protein